MTPMKDERSGKRKADSAAVTTDQKTRPADPAAATTGNPLQLLVAQRITELGNGKPLTLRQVEEQSGRSHGAYRVSRSTVSNILRGRVVKLTPETITGLARALKVDEALIVQAISQTTALTMALPAKLKKLSPEGWKTLLEYGDYLLQREGK